MLKGLTRIAAAPSMLLPVLLALASATSAAAAPPDGPALIRSYCSGCHFEHDGRFERISSIRKSPEGWVMTLFRMQQVHGIALDESVRDQLVHYLADTQGLAPSESKSSRFALERRANVQDLDLGPELSVMCGRCHTLARVALQRRDADEWLKLAHTHIGQWPTTEYQASGRDRPWWQIASEQLPAKLGALFPSESAAWSTWRRQPPRELSGTWMVTGREPGGRTLYGSAQIKRTESGDYSAHYELADRSATALSGESQATVYTGYEWRGRGQLAGRETREIFALSEDGTQIDGRWFDPAHNEEGGDWRAIRADAAPAILAVLPRALKAGSTAEVTLIGTGLDQTATLSFGPGVSARVVSRTANVLHAVLSAAANAEPGSRVVMAGGASSSGEFVVFRQIDRVDVAPAFGIARLGGGKIAPVTAQFEALVSTRLPGGEYLALGPMPAEWSTLPFDAEAKRSNDVGFAGYLEGNGRFVPGGAGPNSARDFSGNNVGNLAIVARVRDGEQALEGRAHLIVTVQRWNTPPIY